MQFDRTTCISLAIPSVTRFAISRYFHSKGHALRKECNAKDLFICNTVDMAVSEISRRVILKYIGKSKSIRILLVSRSLGILSSAVVHYALFPKSPLNPIIPIALNVSSLVVNFLGLFMIDNTFPETINLGNALLV